MFSLLVAPLHILIACRVPALERMSLSDFISHFWAEAGKKCGKAVVFLDGPAAECLHWSGGVGLLARAELLRWGRHKW